MQQQLLVVELALHASHHRVADGALVPQSQQFPPLRREQLAREPQVGLGLGFEWTVHRAAGGPPPPPPAQFPPAPPRAARAGAAGGPRTWLRVDRPPRRRRGPAGGERDNGSGRARGPRRRDASTTPG